MARQSTAALHKADRHHFNACNLNGEYRTRSARNDSDEPSRAPIAVTKSLFSALRLCIATSGPADVASGQTEGAHFISCFLLANATVSPNRAVAFVPSLRRLAENQTMLPIRYRFGAGVRQGRRVFVSKAFAGAAVGLGRWLDAPQYFLMMRPCLVT